MASQKTHRERAEQVASVLLLRTDLYEHPETGEQKTAAELIAGVTFPTELVEAARACERYLVEKGIESRGTVGRTEILPGLRSALALYPKPEETP